MSSNQIFYIANPDKYILSQHGRQKKRQYVCIIHYYMYYYWAKVLLPIYIFHLYKQQ